MAASPSSPPTLSIPGACGLGDSLSDQSLIEDEMESLQKEQSIRIVPDGSEGSSQQPDFGSPDHQAESEMLKQAGPLVIDNEPVRTQFVSGRGQGGGGRAPPVFWISKLSGLFTLAQSRFASVFLDAAL